MVSWYVVSRRLAASAERTRSTALRCVIVINHEIALPLSWSNLLAVRQTLEVRLLRDLLGLGRVAHDPERQPVGPR